MILQETIDKVFDLDIVSVISSYVDLKKSGSNYKGLSPFTNERSPSFMVSPAKGIFKCFSSGKGGKVVNFVMEKESMNYREAIKFLCSKYGIEYLESESTNEEAELKQRKESMYIVNEYAKDYYKYGLSQSQPALNYVYGERGINQETVNKFEIGYAINETSKLTNLMLNAGYNWVTAVECSVIGHLSDKNRLYDRYRDRIMFPIKNISGRISGFGGRILVQNDKAAKYVNSSDSLIYNKSEILFGIYESRKAIIDKNQCIISEGYLDVIMFHQKQVENIVCSGGTALTTEQVKSIKKLTKNAVILFDNDKAGINAAIRGIDVLLAEEMRVKIVVLPQGQDPDDFAKTKNKEEIEKYIQDNSFDFVLFKLNHLLSLAKGNISLKSEAIESVVESISKMPSAIEREIYISQCSKISNIDIDVLYSCLKKYYKDEDENKEEVVLTHYEEYKISRKKILRSCEKKILQYILTYGSLKLIFDEVFLDPEAKKYTEVFIKSERTVFDKVIFELETDALFFEDITYSFIYDRCKTIDLKDFNSLKNVVDEETFMLASEMRREEMSGNTVITMNPSTHKQASTEEIHKALQKEISHNLLFYKILIIEKIIEQETNKEPKQFQKDHIRLHLELLMRLKKELNDN